jgi:hypothetical protein
MHIHGNPMNLNGASLHSAAGAASAAAAQRAANVRKKLMNASHGMELNAEAGFMVGRWSEEGSQNGRQQEHADRSAKPQATDEMPDGQPVSFWA